jgi:tetratricopeptide (TPR) repeat protein
MIALIVLLLAWIVRSIWTTNDSGIILTSAAVQPLQVDYQATQFSGIQNILPAEVPLALLDDFYEHIAEHVPPRQGGGVMQLREQFYQAPREPFDLLRQNLRQNQADHALTERVLHLEERFTAGGGLGAEELTQIGDLAAHSSLKAELLLESARGFGFLMGDDLADVFIRAGLRKAEMQFKDTQPGDRAARSFLQQLDQTKALYRLKDYAALEKRFGLALRLYPRLSVESRRAACLHADALFSASRVREAADAILNVWQADREAGDLGLAEQGDVGELTWRAGRYLSAAERYDEAIGFYIEFLKTPDPRKMSGAWLLISCLRHLGRDAEADAVQARYKLASHVPATQSAFGSSAHHPFG